MLPSALAGIQWVFRRAYRIFNCQEANLQVSRSDIETPSQSNHLTDLRFADLPLSAGLQKGIAEAGFVLALLTGLVLSRTRLLRLRQA